MKHIAEDVDALMKSNGLFSQLSDPDDYVLLEIVNTVDSIQDDTGD